MMLPDVAMVLAMLSVVIVTGREIRDEREPVQQRRYATDTCGVRRRSRRSSNSRLLTPAKVRGHPPWLTPHAGQLRVRRWHYPPLTCSALRSCSVIGMSPSRS